MKADDFARSVRAEEEALAAIEAIAQRVESGELSEEAGDRQITEIMEQASARRAERARVVQANARRMVVVQLVAWLAVAAVVAGVVYLEYLRA